MRPVLFCFMASAAFFASCSETEKTQPGSVEIAAKSAEVSSCAGGSCGGEAGSCGGGGENGSCCGGGGDTAVAAPIPDNAVWSDTPVFGMRCGGCAAKVQRSLANIPGVYGAEVDFATNRARIATDGKPESMAAATAAIQKLGFKTEI